MNNHLPDEYEIVEDEVSATAAVSFSVGFAVACLVFLGDWLKAGRVFAWDMVLYGAVIGAIVTAVLYAIGRLMMSPDFISFLSIFFTTPPSRLAQSKDGVMPENKPEQVEMTANSAALRQSSGQAMTAAAVPKWERLIDMRLVHDGYFRVSANAKNGRSVVLPDGFDVDFLYKVAEARYDSELKLVSQRALDRIDISRDTGDAGMVLEFLQSAGLVEEKGKNYQYKWTDVGALVFPVGLRSALPQRTVRVTKNRGGDSTATTTATTSATAAATHLNGSEG